MIIRPKNRDVTGTLVYFYVVIASLPIHFEASFIYTYIDQHDSNNVAIPKKKKVALTAYLIDCHSDYLPTSKFYWIATCKKAQKTTYAIFFVQQLITMHSSSFTIFLKLNIYIDLLSQKKQTNLTTTFNRVEGTT